MATNTKNAKIFDVIIFPIMVNMMNLQIFFSFFFAKVAFFRILSKSYLAIFCLVRISSCFSTITAINRAILFFKMFCSRPGKSKFFSTNFADTSHGKHLTNCFVRACWRTSNCVVTFNDFRSAKKSFSANSTDYRNFNSTKFIFTLARAKKIFMFFDLPELRFNFNATLAAIDFHIQPCNTCEVL